MKKLLVALLLVGCATRKIEDKCSTCFKVVSATCVGLKEKVECRATVENVFPGTTGHITIYNVVIPGDNVCLHHVNIRDLVKYNEWRLEEPHKKCGDLRE